jgi:hypothetical protein
MWRKGVPLGLSHIRLKKVISRTVRYHMVETPSSDTFSFFYYICNTSDLLQNEMSVIGTPTSRPIRFLKLVVGTKRTEEGYFFCVAGGFAQIFERPWGVEGREGAGGGVGYVYI